MNTCAACNKVVLARGWCQNHYMQKRRRGELPPIPKEDDRSYIINRSAKTEAGCWEWTQCKYQGYGRLVKGGKTYPAHAFSYRAFVGDIPAGMQINHKCHNRSCVNPEHLYAGTQKQNMQDMRVAGRMAQIRGERCGASKITQQTAMQIYIADGTAMAIANRFGVSESLVFAIKKKKVWRHLHE